jgi:hypothetical protein
MSRRDTRELDQNAALEAYRAAACAPSKPSGTKSSRSSRTSVIPRG